jgi:Fe-S cluster biogenesis protein NfuA
MFSRVQEVLDDLKPLIESVGIETELTDAIDGVVTLTLTKADDSTMADIGRLQGFIEREIMEEVEEVKQIVFEGDLGETPEPASTTPDTPVKTPLRVDVIQPSEDVDTCIFNLNRVIGPADSLLVESDADAEGYPLLQGLLALENVESVLAQDKMIIVRRSAGNWTDLSAECVAFIQKHLDGASAEGIRAKVLAVIEADINPAVASHGGFIELLDVKGTEVFVHMGGGCQGCGQAALTLKHGVQSSIMDAVPEVTKVYDTTDHAAGSNPYYQGAY